MSRKIRVVIECCIQFCYISPLRSVVNFCHASSVADLPSTARRRRATNLPRSCRAGTVTTVHGASRNRRSPVAHAHAHVTPRLHPPSRMPNRLAFLFFGFRRLRTRARRRLSPRHGLRIGGATASNAPSQYSTHESYNALPHPRPRHPRSLLDTGCSKETHDGTLVLRGDSKRSRKRGPPVKPSTVTHSPHA